MTTETQLQSNRNNALRSTGPRTPAGKENSSHNAIRHGALSAEPVLPGERVEEWERHQAGILDSLAPVGAMETELANRVAQCLWRLRRLTAYETAVTAVGLAEVPDEMERAADNDIFDKGDASRLRKTLKALAGKRESLMAWESSLILLR